MRFDKDTRRSLTEDEKKRGIDWLNENGFEHNSIAGGTVQFWSKNHGDFTVMVLNPHSVWATHIYKENDEIAFNFGEFSECKESVDDVLKLAGTRRLFDFLFGK